MAILLEFQFIIYSRKILSDRLIVTIETNNSVADQQIYISKSIKDLPNASYIAGILGSKFLSFFIRNYYDEINDAFPQIKVNQLKSLPIRPINFFDPTDKKRHDQMVALVDQMLFLHKQLPLAKTDQEKTILQRQIDTTDRQIDQLVYDLYELTEEEIKVIEKATP